MEDENLQIKPEEAAFQVFIRIRPLNSKEQSLTSPENSASERKISSTIEATENQVFFHKILLN